MEGGREKEAIGALKVLLALYPDYALVHNDLGVLYHKDGDKEKAFSHYKKAVELQPENFNFQKNLADFYYSVLGRIGDAIEHYCKIIEIDPEDIETHLILGHISVVIKKFKEAKVFYNKVLEIDLYNKDAQQKLNNLRYKNVGFHNTI